MGTHQMENTGGALQQSVALTRQAKADLSAQIGALDGRLAGIGQSWVGEGSVAFIRVRQAWNDQVRRLLSALEQFGDDLEGVDRTFDVADADVSAGLRQLAGRLG